MGMAQYTGPNSRNITGQILLNTRDDLIRQLEINADIDCFIRTHSESEVNDGRLGLFFNDIDNKDDLETARKAALKSAKQLESFFGVKPHVQSSGFKGYHVILPFKPDILPGGQAEASNLLRYLRKRFGGPLADKQLGGDLRHLFRLPYTQNSKGIAAYGDGSVKMVQAWDGNRADIRWIYGDFKIEMVEEELARKRSKASKYLIGRSSTALGIRPQIQQLIDQLKETGYLGHTARLAILFELIANRRTVEEIHQVFQFASDYRPALTDYFIQDARNKQYKPFKSENLDAILNGENADTNYLREKLGYVELDARNSPCNIHSKCLVSRTELENLSKKRNVETSVKLKTNESERKLLEVALDTFKELAAPDNQKFVRPSSFVEALVAKNVPEDQAKQVFKVLVRAGVIYEVKPGFYRRLA